MARLLFLIPLALFAIAAIWLAVPVLEGRDPGLLPSALIGKPAPTDPLPPLVAGKPGLDGRALGLMSGPMSDSGTGVGADSGAGTLSEKPIRLVNFFASWCVPCRAEHPLLTELAARRTATLYGVNYKDKPADALAWLDALGDPYARIGRDPDGRAAIEWGVYGVPETYVLDHRGRVRHRHVGPLSKADMEAVILPLIAILQKETP